MLGGQQGRVSVTDGQLVVLVAAAGAVMLLVAVLQWVGVLRYWVRLPYNISHLAIFGASPFVLGLVGCSLAVLSISIAARLRVVTIPQLGGATVIVAMLLLVAAGAIRWRQPRWSVPQWAQPALDRLGELDHSD